MNFVLKSIYYFMFIFIVNLFCSLHYNCVNTLEFDDLDIDYVNGYYFNMSNLDISVNRKKKAANTLNVNVQLINDVSSELNVKCNVSTRAFGYQIPTGLAFRSKVCESGAGKLIYDILVRDAGIKECPPEKGLYQLQDVEYDFTKLNVPFLSGARLQFQIEVFNDEVTKLLQFRLFIVT